MICLGHTRKPENLKTRKNYLEVMKKKMIVKTLSKLQSDHAKISKSQKNCFQQ
jgi:hypothetical protein